MKKKANRLKILRLVLYSVTIIMFILLLKSYVFYENIKVEVYNNAKKEARILQDYMMSVRETYLKQFFKSGLEVNDVTLGFLPAHANSVISNRFKNKNEYNYYIRNVSDRPRNPSNMADEEELKAIELFKNQPNADEYFEKYEENGKQYFQYATPIFIEEYCMQCHGKREDAIPAIRDRYAKAYNYHVGDVRGVVSIKVPGMSIENKLYSFIKQEIGMAFLVFLLIGTTMTFLFREVIFRLNDIEADAKDDASRDALTGLYNRSYLKRLKELDESFVVAFIDIDKFKSVNDTYGHDMGDAVLKEFASVLNSLTREGDIVCRYGGEEFLVIVTKITLKNAIEKFNKVRIEIEHRDIVFNDIKLKITVSIGLDAGSEDDRVEDVITNADKALYEAKVSGRNRLEIYSR